MLVWKYFEAQADTRKRKRKCLVTVSKCRICEHLVVGKNDFVSSEITHILNNSRV